MFYYNAYTKNSFLEGNIVDNNFITMTGFLDFINESFISIINLQPQNASIIKEFNF